MIRVMPILGTRPEAVKLAPVIKALEHDEGFQCKVCVTGQHRQMLDQILDIFEIKPAYDLDIMQAGQDLYDVTSRVLMGLRDILIRERPDVVLVQGDTTTVFASSLAAFYAGIPVGHVEAGLRTRDKRNPFPEEANRRLASVLADVHFAPTEQAKKNLLAEEVDDCRIFVTGNTVIDALFWALQKIQQNSYPEVQQIQEWTTKLAGDHRIVLITAHRRESFGQPFRDICEAIKSLAQRYRDVYFIYPVHLNPSVRGPVYEILKDQANVLLIDPLSYLPFIWLMNRSYLVLTDSGGVQEEAPSLGKPVLVMRETTERPEGLTCGTSILVKRDKQQIVSTISSFLDDRAMYDKTSRIANPYGDGKASGRILQALRSQFGG